MPGVRDFTTPPAGTRVASVNHSRKPTRRSAHRHSSQVHSDLFTLQPILTYSFYRSAFIADPTNVVLSNVELSTVKIFLILPWTILFFFLMNLLLVKNAIKKELAKSVQLLLRFGLSNTFSGLFLYHRLNIVHEKYYVLEALLQSK